MKITDRENDKQACCGKMVVKWNGQKNNTNDLKKLIQAGRNEVHVSINLAWI